MISRPTRYSMATNDTVKPIKSVLVTRFSALGDVAMTIPIIYPVCVANPHVNFVFATRKMPASMFVNRPGNLTVLGIDLDKYTGITGPWKLARNLHHRYNFDAFADLHDVLRTWLMKLALKRHVTRIATIDKGRSEKKLLTSGKSRTPVMSTHERYKNVFKNLGLKTGEEFNTILDYGDPIKSHMVPAKPDDARWIAVAPFSQHKGKVYPWEQMQLVIGELSKNENYQIFLFGGGKEERDAFDPIIGRYNNVASVPHIKHTFIDELALMSRCDVMLTMDSANMHLASLVNLPVVSVWGATHPACGFMGWHQAMRDTVQLDLDCRPCSVFGNKKCRFGDYHCMSDIDPEMIINKVKKVLQRYD